MVYADDSYQDSVTDLARRGNLQALSYWINSLLAPYRLFARVSPMRRGHLRILIELQPSPARDASTTAFRQRLVRYICHQLWKLNAPTLEGAIVVCRYVGQSKALWQQSVRIVSPARRAHIANSPQAVQSRLKTATSQRRQFKTLRSVLISGSSVAAFVLGCWLGYADAPSEQTQASAVISQFNRGSDKVQAALETVPVLKPAKTNGEPGVSLMFGGDVSFGENYDRHVGNNSSWTLSPLEELRQADISMLNLDSPLTQATQSQLGKKANLKAAPDRVNVLLTGGIDVVNMANDTTMDYQTAGLSETLATLNKSGISTVGAGHNATEARRPVVMEVKGQRVAYLSYYDSDLHAATDREAGTNPRRNDRIATDIKAIRDQVDWVVVNYHWGEELAKYPGDWQIDLARFTVDQGADMVVGHHAKVLQGAEIYHGRPIVYSLGNFIFGGQSSDKTASDYDTAVLKVGLNQKQMRVEFVPIEVRNFQAHVVKGDRATQILNQINSVSDIFEEPLMEPMILDAQTNTAKPVKEPAKSDPVKPDPIEAAPAPTPAPAPAPKADPNKTWNQDSFTNGPSPSQPERHGQGMGRILRLIGIKTDTPKKTIAQPAIVPSPIAVPNTLESPKRRFAQAGLPAANSALQPLAQTVQSQAIEAAAILSEGN
jgi:poly-gamma-glutamate capsule biosynthesis protein CapA/YwtB (metallophosphatase superfamily)